MNYWQKRALVKVSKVDFFKEQEKIEDAFYSICEPLLDNEGIEFDKKESILTIGNNKYTLTIGANGFGITLEMGPNRKICKSFLINEEMKYAFSITPHSKIPDYQPLETMDINYEKILNSIMDDMIM